MSTGVKLVESGRLKAGLSLNGIVEALDHDAHDSIVCIVAGSNVAYPVREVDIIKARIDNSDKTIKLIRLKI
jgi:hypothetical protein